MLEGIIVISITCEGIFVNCMSVYIYIGTVMNRVRVLVDETIFHLGWVFFMFHNGDNVERDNECLSLPFSC